ncbi:MAG TPA: iron-containing alcohol dehydrogenase PsrA [Acetobacteraceae bacterium]|nr:iron-containing alcohol dehydrogenase PsrA [Acetobacteraceae bacterium]
MTDPWRYVNPVKITFGLNAIERIKDVIAGRSYCLLTYNDNPFFSDVAKRVADVAGPPAVTVRDVEPNPDYDSLRAACASFAGAQVSPQVIVALGGGSVIDTAKVLAAAGDDFSRVQGYLEGRHGAEALRHLPIIAVPTTAGTGSEVTSWATVWDTSNRKKYSLARPELYPEHAVVDPLLTVGVPRGLTVSTGLDALSHALESIWNVNSNPVSANHAVVAAREIMSCLPRLASDLDNVDLRTRMARASLFAGLAFSNTKTAIAHSLSYYLTLHYGVVHGIACSFSLPAVMRSVIGLNAECDAALEQIFGPDLTGGAEELTRFLHRLDVGTRVTDYGVTRDEWISAIDAALTGERGRNFIGEREAMVGEAFG